MRTQTFDRRLSSVFASRSDDLAAMEMKDADLARAAGTAGAARPG